MGLRGLFEGWHLVVLLVVVVIVFGWKRLPDAARSLGRSARILKSELGDMSEDGKSKASEQTVPGQTAPPASSVPGEAQSFNQSHAQAPAQPPVQQPHAQQPPVQQSPEQTRNWPTDGQSR